MRVLPLLVTLPLFAACGGSDGNVVSVFPETGFVGRTTTVEVTGNDTSFGVGSTVDFGEGVTVETITVVSPNALQVDLTIAADAAIGPTDVSVDGSTAVGAFELLSPFTVELGTFEQGGFGSITITNLDLLHPFDLTTDQDGAFVNLDVTSTNDGVTLAISDATANTLTLSATIDVLATETGEITISASDGTTPNTTLLDSVTVAPRTPTVLTANGSLDFTVADNGSLFEITATELAMLQVKFSSADAFVPAIDILPASGKFSEELGFHALLFATEVFDNRTMAANEKFYVVISDFAGGGFQGNVATRTISRTGLTPVVDTGSNDTAATGQTGTGLTVELDGTLSADADIDCVRVTTTAINQKIHVFTTDEGGMSDTIVTIFDINNTTEITPATTSDDADTGEDVLTGPLAVIGTRSVCIGSSTFVEGVVNAPYKAFVVVE